MLVRMEAVVPMVYSKTKMMGTSIETNLYMQATGCKGMGGQLGKKQVLIVQRLSCRLL